MAWQGWSGKKKSNVLISTLLTAYEMERHFSWLVGFRNLSMFMYIDILLWFKPGIQSNLTNFVKCISISITSDAEKWLMSHPLHIYDT